MSVIGFSFKRMLAEKKKAATGKINVSNNMILTEVKEAKVNMGGQKKQGAIEFSFNYKTKYSPDVGLIELEGSAAFLGPEELVKKNLERWEKEKKLTKEVLEEVYNFLLVKCNVQTLVMGRDMGLPPHIPLPKVSGKGA